MIFHAFGNAFPVKAITVTKQTVPDGKTSTFNVALRIDVDKILAKQTYGVARFKISIEGAIVYAYHRMCDAHEAEIVILEDLSTLGLKWLMDLYVKE